MALKLRARNYFGYCTINRSAEIINNCIQMYYYWYHQNETSVMYHKTFILLLRSPLTLINPIRSGLFFSCQIRGGGADSAPPWISALEPLLKLGWTTILERYKRGPRIQKMRCLASKLREWRPFENSDLKSDFLENCHRSSHLLSKFWEGRF